MKNKCSLICYLLVAILSCAVYGATTEIQLFEVVEVETFIEDEPFGNPGEDTNNPPRPNQFHATINNNVLCVSAENLNTTTVVVKNQTGESILNQQFVGFTTELINSTGFHTIEIFNGNLKLVGYFLVQ